MKFNVLQHKLVPEHHLLSDEEAKRVLATLRITMDQLPKIKKADPVIHVLEQAYGCKNCGNRILEPEAGKPRVCAPCKKAETDCSCKKNERGPIPEGSILKIKRISETAGVSEAYRLVVGR